MKSIKQCELKLLSHVHGLEPTTQQNLFVVALEVLYDSLIHWLRIGCHVMWEEDQFDVVGRVATKFIETEQYSLSLLTESSVPCTLHIFEKLHRHPCLRVCLVFDGNLLVFEGTGSLGFANHQKSELLCATYICPYQKSNPLLALLSSSAPFSLKLMVLFGSNCQKSPVLSRLKMSSAENCLSKS